MINDRIIQMIQERFGAPIRYPQQCEALSMAILEATGQTLGTTTLKRLLGFVAGVANARTSSLDILAQYLGYPDFNLLSKDVDENSEISDFRPVESIDSADLLPGEQIRITYHPNRVLTFEYIGDNLYEVKKSYGSKLLEGDRLLIAGFYIGFELLVSDVERDGQHLGAYQGAKQGGLTSVEIMR